MATRSTIALEFADGTVGKVYCHWDGYLEHNGQILLKHYNNPFILRDLIDLGDISSLAPVIGTKHSFDDRAACEGVTTFYGRDRGETGCEATYYKSYADYRDNCQFEEYNYILRNINGVATWFVEFYGDFDGELTQAIKDEQDSKAQEEMA